jgi:hypothetical protein
MMSAQIETEFAKVAAKRLQVTHELLKVGAKRLEVARERLKVGAKRLEVGTAQAEVEVDAGPALTARLKIVPKRRENFGDPAAGTGDASGQCSRRARGTAARGRK